MKNQRRYRGSRQKIGLLIPALVALCLIAAAALYVINNNMTFTKEGSFFIPEKDETPQDVEANLIIEEPEIEIEPEPAPAPPVSDNTSDVRGYFVPVGSVKSVELFDAELIAAKTSGANTLILEVKAEDGTLSYSTKTSIGVSTGLAGDSAMLSESIKKARESGYRVALYMSCFKDNEAARKNQIYSVRTANKIIWLDGENMRWLSPYSEDACEYLAETVRELASFVPDEIILSNISFPTFGKTEIIEYEDSGISKEEKLSEVIADLKAAAGDVKLSAVYENYKGNALLRSGQNSKAFADAFGTVYVKENGGNNSASFADVADEFKNAVPIKSSPSGNEYVIKN